MIDRHLCLIVLTEKVLRELMETTEERICKVREFLQDIKQSLEYRVVPIEDPYGPSIRDASISAIVVSEETVMGARSINEHRKEMVRNHFIIFMWFCINLSLIDA